MMKPKHARLAPSASSRWIKCPGSIKLSELVPTPVSGDSAKEGTAAHSLGEKCLESWLNECYTITAGDFEGTVIESEGKKYIVDEDMYEAVDVYLETIREILGGDACAVHHDQITFKVEEKFSLEWLHKDMFGSNDCCIYNELTKTLHVIDYKHGKGIVVEPAWNTQLMMYALGAIYTIWKDLTKDSKPIAPQKLFDKVELIIVQPRAYHEAGEVRRWETSVQDLMFWATQILKPSADETELEGATLRAGEHCYFCPAMPVCNEHASNAALVAKTEFNNPVLPSPDMLSPQDMARILELSDTFSKWSKSVKEYAQQQMQAGFNIPGQKLVKKKSNRIWNDVVISGVEDRLTQLLGEGAFNKKMLTPAQAEKALKKAGHSPEAALDGLIVKPDAGLTMVADSDRRKPVIPTALLDFLNDEDFLQ